VAQGGRGESLRQDFRLTAARTGYDREVLKADNPQAAAAIRLSPRDPYIANWYSWIGLAHLLQSHTKDAVLWLEKARDASPRLPVPHMTLTSAYALRNETEHAAAELAEARRLRQDYYSSIALLRARVGYWGVPKMSALYDATFFAGLRKAGMPEE
jgi:hypothetical protein